jgi:hypothetical protein
MKDLKTFLAEQSEKLTAKYIDDNFVDLAEKLSSDLKSVLGDRYVVFKKASKNLGNNIYLHIHDTKPYNNIAENSPASIKLMMHLSSNYGKLVNLSSVSWELVSSHYKQRDVVKFRKITSKTSIEDANKKLVDWFKKTKPALESLIS